MNTVCAPLYSPAEPWSGRDDGPGTEHARWHSVIRGEVATGAVALIGYASDEGVERNGGRVGAAEGPTALRRALADLAIHDEHPRVDAGTVTTQGADLEGSQRELSKRVRDLAAAGTLVVVLGGGHETSFATHRGVREARGEMSIINLDAHFDLRDSDRPTSGTPFAQVAQLCGDQFNYSVLGVSEPNNTATLFDTAARLGVRTVLDTELAQLSPAECARMALDCVAGQRPIHLSIDLDVLPAATAPGVSAPAGYGVALDKVRAMAVAVAQTGRLALVDVVELNPRYDIDARTARTAARLIHDIVAAHVGR
ncbi:formimidoylglutamase [Corynebacterium sanguinis]|uniref:formimidoylglutamase n=1 Tax=Corynebacterium sanguinis TaxID=2594913 RepID=UPI0011A0D838|nr:formimidoylglutamase [Corynebacterium sanguinis]MCT1614242.1 formimidoylglutamase [Corynebacterium sanguinis]TVS26315.1 formimidoylglutamase [Corynebacterium sanguinis]